MQRAIKRTPTHVASKDHFCERKKKRNEKRNLWKIEKNFWVLFRIKETFFLPSVSSLPDQRVGGVLQVRRKRDHPER